jgi:peptide/nickel transport system substrate-binding protein
MSTYSPAAARTILTGAGFTYRGSQLLDPRGNDVELDIHVIAGWSDWVASNQIITRNLRDIGIDSQVELEPDWGAWQPGAYATRFPTLLWQGASQGSPYGYFYSNLSQNAFVPSGESGETTGNWHHFSDAKATTLLNKWKTTLNAKKQQQIATQLQGIFLDQLPIVPIFIGPRWSTYSTRYFHCFGNKKNYFGDPIFTTFPDNILSFTRICPGGKAGP